MKILYFDCGMGAAGDMLCASLLDILPSPESFAAEFNALGIPGLKMELCEAKTCSIRGSEVKMLINGMEELPDGDSCPEGKAGHSHDGHHEHLHDEHHGHHHDERHSHNHDEHHSHSHDRSFEAVMAIIDSLPLSRAVRENAAAVYESIAKAEAKVHGSSVSKVHFHELGSMDAIADIICFSMLIEKLAPDRIEASPIHVGSGYVRCAHGMLPVPAPATAELLRGIPSYGGQVEGELCTPTGAALLRHFAKSFGPMPLMSTKAVGYGVGTKVFPRANCLRAMLGDSEDIAESVDEIFCNIDDMTGEAIAFAAEVLLEAGALDVYTVPIGMKKSRPAVMLCCICRCDDTERLSALVLRHTTSLGVRISRLRRIVLPRKLETIQTPCGPVRVKSSGEAYKPEYEDIAEMAKKNGLTLAEAAELVRQSAEKER